MAPLAEHGFGQGPIGGKMEIGEDDLSATQQRPLGRERFFDFDDHVGPREQFARVGHQRRAVLDVPLVGDSGADARPGLEQHLVAGPGQFVDAHRQHGHAVFVAFDFLRNSDDHPAPPDSRVSNSRQRFARAPCYACVGMAPKCGSSIARGVGAVLIASDHVLRHVVQIEFVAFPAFACLGALAGSQVQFDRYFAVGQVIAEHAQQIALIFVAERLRIAAKQHDRRRFDADLRGIVDLRPAIAMQRRRILFQRRAAAAGSGRRCPRGCRACLNSIWA